MNEAQLITFLQKAQLRGGGSFLVQTVELYPTGEIQGMTGVVKEFDGNTETLNPMSWSGMGISLSGSRDFDLIERKTIVYLPLQDAPPDSDANPPNPPQQ